MRLVVDVWSTGDLYEPYVGRWSRLVAAKFVEWLAPPEAARWLDVGCGTGAVTHTILATAAPLAVVGVDPSADYVGQVRKRADADRADFTVGDAQKLDFPDESFDFVVSGLVLNFLADPVHSLREMRRVARRQGTVAAYVWDYPGEMQLMKFFWDTAVGLDQTAAALHEGRRFSFCQRDDLAAMFRRAALTEVEARPIVVVTRFENFDDYWTPFLGGQGPAPSYAVSLGEDRRAALADAIRRRLPISEDGSITLTARAWAVRGKVRVSR
ncbi:MAG: class I SAM-dependent methyltransferase [Acidimicrobiales bacterium]